MGKLTFRADDDLVARVEELDASKSEVMREALRAYLGESDPRPEREDTLDGFLARRIDELVEERLRARAADRDVNIDISIEGTPANAEMSDAASTAASDSSSETEPPSDETADPSPGESDAARQCGQCGEPIDPEHVYCPNCGEKRSRRVFCECGDELRTDWSFCPGCGRRTPAADVLDQS
jgi:Arc/MetJ-type ribon-helix-helix transcriptional regulator